MGDGAAPLTGLSETQRAEAMRRFLVLRPHLEDGATLTAAARSAGVSLRTAQRWLFLYRQGSLAGLATKRRRDRGTRRFPTGVVDLVEGLALRRPEPSTAWIHRQVVEVAHREGWAVPSYSTVRSIGVSGIFGRDGAIPRSLYETPVGLLVWAGPGGEPSRGLHEPSPVMSRWDSRCPRGTGRRLGSGWFPAVGSFGGSFGSGIPMSRSAVSCECCLHPQANYDP